MVLEWEGDIWEITWAWETGEFWENVLRAWVNVTGLFGWENAEGEEVIWEAVTDGDFTKVLGIDADT